MLRSVSTDNKIILKNFSYLTLMKFFNIGFRFILVAYLIRVLGKNNYGLATWLDSIIQYFLMIINFGFDIYATKYIIDFKNNKNKINEVVSAIFIIKLILFIGSIIAVFIIGSSNEFSAYKELLFLYIFCGIGEVLFPLWYFQGKENLKPATFIVFISRLFLIIATIFFVTKTDDVYYYILFLVLSSAIMGILGIVFIYKYYDFKFIWVPFKKSIVYFKESFPFFLGIFLSLVFNSGTIFLIGKYCRLDQVAGFDLSVKIVMVGFIPFQMLQQAVFPTLSRTKNKKLLKKLISRSIILGCIIGIVIFILSSNLILWFGGESMMEYVSTLKTLSILEPFVAATFILGSCSLVAFGYIKEYNFSLISTSVIYLIILLVLYFFNLINFWNLVYLRVFGDVLMVIIRLYYTYKRKII